MDPSTVRMEAGARGGPNGEGEPQRRLAKKKKDADKKAGNLRLYSASRWSAAWINLALWL
jgi:hypothetical protein